MDSEPDSFAVGLEVTRIPDTESAPQLDPGTPVFTHFYHPAAGQSVNEVFGMDFGTPVGSTRGRFVSHPQGDRNVSITDDLHAIVIVAVPPWDQSAVSAYDRRGNRRRLRAIDWAPPEESLP